MRRVLFCSLNFSSQTLAIKFGNEENAKKFFDEFDRMKKFLMKMEAKKIREESDGDGDGVPDVTKKEDEVQEKLSELQVKET